MKQLFKMKRALAALLLALILGMGALAEAPSAQPTDETLPPPEQILVTEGPLLPDLGRQSDGPTPEPTPAPIVDSPIEDDGLLRVRLRSLGEVRQLHLTLAGVYAVEGDPGFRFDRDARATLSAVSGSVWLAVGGLTIDMGPSLTLTRHLAAEGDENGLYIDESEKDTLYCGDLAVTAEGDALAAVLTIGVEDYLLGVVAYEMSDSFPLEALKAQAVAARTYAMQRKWHSGGKDYDLVDTTADQVFKGYDPGRGNVIRAVEETRGVVGLWDGGFATCYYTASNGGQTALASQIWGRNDSDGYLTMRDDPYDLENPKSLVNALTVTAECEGSAKLKAMLESALTEPMATRGYGDGEWALASIAAIEPVNPRFEGSRMCEGLRFDLRVKALVPAATPEPTDTPAPTEAPAATDTPGSAASAEETDAPAPTGTPAPTPAPMEWVMLEETFPVTLGVYDQIKGGLSLGLNGRDYELVDVTAEADESGAPLRFTLSMRRFGHGVGMSQRGAEWMARQHGMTWRDILAFYYPGMTLARMAWPESGLTDLAALPGGVGAARPRPTPTPTPAPLPELREGERYAVVTASSLNVREQPTTAVRAIDQLEKGRRIIVSSEPDADGWVGIRTGEGEGFVKAEYLEFE